MLVELKDLRKSFGPQQVLKGIDLTVSAGTRVALIGPNGSGKSTLLRALMGLVRCEGRVLLDGHEPFEHRREVAHHIAYVPQVAPRLGASVREVTRAVCELRGLAVSRVKDVSEFVLFDYDEHQKKPFSTLSGGMKQKLLIALAFATNAELFILDEPTASLDAAARARFFELLVALPKTVTVLLCSHRLEDVNKLSSRAIELQEGRIARDLTLLELESVAKAEASCAGVRV